MAFGSLVISDSLQALLVGNGLVAHIGEDNVWQVFSDYLVAHNRILSDQLSTFVDVSTARLIRTGIIDTMVMEEVDSTGMPQAQKIVASQFIGVPLIKYRGGLQWTNDYLRVVSTKEISKQFLAMLAADKIQLQKALKRSIFYATNYSFTDRLVDNAVLPVKRLINGDNIGMTVGPNGEIFSANHTHYMVANTAWSTATAVQKAADIAALTLTITEHFNEGTTLIYINSGQYPDIKSMPGFVSYLDVRIIGAVTANQSYAKSLDPVNIYDRAIGITNEGAEVWIKPWIPVNYAFAFNPSQMKPVYARVRGVGDSFDSGDPLGVTGNTTNNSLSFGDLQIAAQFDNYPLHSTIYEREIGFGVRNRINGAVLDLARPGGATYTNPVI